MLGIVGESGCGKSVTMLSIMRLLSTRRSETTRERPSSTAQELLAKSNKAMRSIRGREIAMIFQDPMTSLNPVYRVGWQLAEAAMLHNPDLSKAELRERSLRDARRRSGSRARESGWRATPTSCRVACASG